VIVHFWTNYQLLMPQELIKQANWLVDGFDASLPKHEKLTMNPEDMIQLKTMLPDPAA
jgi:hypothetical protein